MMPRPAAHSSRRVAIRTAGALALDPCRVRLRADRRQLRASIPTIRSGGIPRRQNAARVKPIDLSDRYDAIENSFLGAGERLDRRAANVNTLDEVP